VSRALDVLGERWTLLVVRNLMAGPQRYSDLAAQLPGMASNLLGTRLRMLEEHGVVRRTVLPPPAARTVYELTERGRELDAVIGALGRWGRRLLTDHPGGLAFQPHLVTLGLQTQMRLEALPEDELEFGFDLDIGRWVVHVLARRTEDGRLRPLPDRIRIEAVEELPGTVPTVVRGPALALIEGHYDDVAIAGPAPARAVVAEIIGAPAPARRGRSAQIRKITT
jgi:DNA-binding HxlR family transcriptional regulator